MRQSQPNRTILLGVVCVILGLMIGAGLGLLLSGAINPPLSGSKAFAGLAVNTKEDYIVLVGAAYSLDHDLERAQAQLERLEAPNINHWIASLIDRYLVEDQDAADIRALVELAHGLGVQSAQVVAYLATLTPPPTGTPLPAPTLAVDRPTPAVSPTAIPSTEEPTATPQPTDTPPPLPTPTAAPSNTPVPPTPTAVPSDTPQPKPTNTSKPQPSNTPKPANTPVAKWTWTARLVGPGHEGQECDGGHQMIRVTVLDAAGNQMSGVWVHEKVTGRYQVSGHKGDDPYWGPGEIEFNQLPAGQVCIASGEGGACESDLTRFLPCHDPPPFEDVWAAGYCECAEPGITEERCRELFASGKWLGISHYLWRVEFKRSR